jgi:hypothetical protein
VLVRVLASHPFAKNAEEWGTPHRRCDLEYPRMGGPPSTINQRSFTSISTPYPPSKFTGYYTTPQNGVLLVPTGPDGTSGEEDE